MGRLAADGGARFAGPRVGHRNRHDQCLGVGVHLVVQQRFTFGKFHNPAQIHHRKREYDERQPALNIDHHHQQHFFDPAAKMRRDDAQKTAQNRADGGAVDADKYARTQAADQAAKDIASHIHPRPGRPICRDRCRSEYGRIIPGRPSRNRPWDRPDPSQWPYAPAMTSHGQGLLSLMPREMCVADATI